MGPELDAQQHPHTAAMAAKLKTEQGQAAYRKRKWIAEPPNGWIKNVPGAEPAANGSAQRRLNGLSGRNPSSD